MHLPFLSCYRTYSQRWRSTHLDWWLCCRSNRQSYLSYVQTCFTLSTHIVIMYCFSHLAGLDLWLSWALDDTTTSGSLALANSPEKTQSFMTSFHGCIIFKCRSWTFSLMPSAHHRSNPRFYICFRLIRKGKERSGETTDAIYTCGKLQCIWEIYIQSEDASSSLC